MRRRVGGARKSEPARRNLTPGEILLRVEQVAMVLQAVNALKGRTNGR